MLKRYLYCRDLLQNKRSIRKSDERHFINLIFQSNPHKKETNKHIIEMISPEIQIGGVFVAGNGRVTAMLTSQDGTNRPPLSNKITESPYSPIMYT